MNQASQLLQYNAFRMLNVLHQLIATLLRIQASISSIQGPLFS